MISYTIGDWIDSLEQPSQAQGWSDHPSFPGVRLRRLVAAEQSGGCFTTLLVSLAPGAQMLPHRHENEIEQHLVLKGGGRMTLLDQSIDYRSGVLAVIPQGAEHSVAAGDDGMTLQAVFVPRQLSSDL